MPRKEKTTMILTLLKELKSFFKRDEVIVDNVVFQLHSRFTVIVLVVFSTIVAFSEYFGHPISCFTTSQSISKKIVDQFCWISTTYSIPDFWNKSVGYEVIYPGVGISRDETDRFYHSYYQWVVFFLYMQAIAFSAPKYFWTIKEGGKIEALTKNLKYYILKDKAKHEKLSKLERYLSLAKGTHEFNFIFFVLMEIANLINVIGQMYLSDLFLNGKYWSLGTNFIHWYKTDQFKETDNLDYGLNSKIDPLLEVFPRMTKCTFYQFGDSGDVEKHDALCLLKINNVNEKIFLFTWFWYHFLALATATSLLYRFFTFFSTDVRIMAIQYNCQFLNGYLAQKVVKSQSLSDLFLLLQLSANMDEGYFKYLCEMLTHQASSTSSSSSIGYSDGKSNLTCETEIEMQIRKNEENELNGELNRE